MKLLIILHCYHFRYINIENLKMAKSIFAIALLMAMVCISVAQQTSGPKINAATVNAVLTNDRVLSNYINCLLGELQCTRDGRLLKGMIS